MSSQTLTIRRPDDWHVHLRDGDMLRAVAPYTARQFVRAIVMPNLVPPVTTPSPEGWAQAHRTPASGWASTVVPSSNRTVPSPRAKTAR